MKKNNSQFSDQHDLHIDPEALNHYYALSGVQPLPAMDGLRFKPTFGNAEGYREIINLTEGFQVVLGDITCHEETYVSMKSDPTLKMHFRLEGNSGLETTSREESQITHHTLGVLLHPEGIEKQEHYLAGEHERSITLICEPQFLEGRYKTVLDKLPLPITQYACDGSTDTYNGHFPMRTDMVTAANAILNCNLEGVLRKAYCYAKSIELLVLSLQLIIETEANIGNPEKGLTQRDIDGMHKARERLEADYIKPPTISELAREIGINEAKLMHAFKQLFGQTIFDYTQNLRMDKAKELLEKTELSITEIAFDVGYEYSSNFTTAFKRRFNITPSAAREGFKR